MAYVTPNSSIQLYKGVKLAEGAEDTLYFASRSAQESYFGGSGVTPTWTASNFTFIGDKDIHKIRVSASFSTVKDCNYLRYKNTGYENKWMYCFIKNVAHISDECTEIEYKIDPLQTWLPSVDYTLKQCHILRQHENYPGTEKIGGNIQPENIQIPAHHPLKQGNDYYQMYNPFANGTYICCMLPKMPRGLFYWWNGPTGWKTWDIASMMGMFPPTVEIDDVPVGNPITIFDMASSSEMDKLTVMLGLWGDLVLHTWIVPKDSISLSQIDTTNWKLSNYSGSTLSGLEVPVNIIGTFVASQPGLPGLEPTEVIPVPTGPVHSNSLVHTFTANLEKMPNDGQTGYTVHNKKLFTNPFSYFVLEASNGQQEIYSFEDFTNSTSPYNQPTFRLILSVLDENVAIEPSGYDYLDEGWTKQVVLPPVPAGAFSASNASYVEKAISSTIMQLGTIAATASFGVAGGVAASGANMLVNEATPRNKGGSVNNLSNIAHWYSQSKGFKGYIMYPDNYYQIDRFFDAYGYTQNGFDVPSIDHRKLWCYIQTDAANFTPINVPAKYMQEINELFDKGIRFHKGDSTIGNLTGDNGMAT